MVGTGSGNERGKKKHGGGKEWRDTWKILRRNKVTTEPRKKV